MRLTLIALTLLASGLVVTLFAEWRAGEQDAADAAHSADLALQPRAGPSSPVRPPDPPATMAALQAEQLQAWLQTTLDRPLFEPARRPVRAANQAKVTLAPQLPRLAGVLISAQRRQVIFAGTDGKPIIVGEGETVDGFTVKEIAAGQVTVVGPDGAQVQVLHPSFDPNRRLPQSPLALVPPPIGGIPGLPGVPPNIPAVAQRGQAIQPSSD